MGPTGAQMAAFSDAVKGRGGTRVKAAAVNEVCPSEAKKPAHKVLFAPTGAVSSTLILMCHTVTGSQLQFR